jgi:NAD-dependent deacetylase
MMDLKIEECARRIKNSKYCVAFTGAGMSVESGIPPFRGTDGLWNKYDPIVLEIGYFHRNTHKAWEVIRELFYDFFGQAKPNTGHKVLATWERAGILKSVITQNIDNLHQVAGSSEVYEFHGTASTLACTACGAKYRSETINLESIPPKCAACGGILKPDFIFFGEGIPSLAYSKSYAAASNSDVFIVIGTTGEVMPASMLPSTAKSKGAFIIEINPETSNFSDRITDIHLAGKAGTVLAKLDTAIALL